MARGSNKRGGAKRSARAQSAPASRQQLRIIGGEWRGRRLPFTATQGLRPTGDRIRETLFNWLSTAVIDARCLDLFAGSGALGLEALSRGAAHCDFVDSQHSAAANIREHIATLGAEQRARVYAQSAEAFLQGHNAQFNIVFLDPPFGDDLLSPSCATLVASGCLAPDALIYLEHAAEQTPALPEYWVEVRRKVSGGVAYGLYRSTP